MIYYTETNYDTTSTSHFRKYFRPYFRTTILPSKIDIDTFIKYESTKVLSYVSS